MKGFLCWIPPFLTIQIFSNNAGIPSTALYVHTYSQTVLGDGRKWRCQLSCPLSFLKSQDRYLPAVLLFIVKSLLFCQVSLTNCRQFPLHTILAIPFLTNVLSLPADCHFIDKFGLICTLSAHWPIAHCIEKKEACMEQQMWSLVGFFVNLIC